MLSRTRIWRSAMMKIIRTISFVVAGLLVVSVPLLAHHGGASYDTAKTVTVKGTVTEYVWSNPHVFVKLDGKDDSGNTVHWIVEGQNPVSMMAIGGTKNRLNAGHEVQIHAMPAKNGIPVAFLWIVSHTAP